MSFENIKSISRVQRQGGIPEGDGELERRNRGDKVRVLVALRDAASPSNGGRRAQETHLASTFDGAEKGTGRRYEGN